MSEPASDVFFAPFRLDPSGRLWRGASEVALRPKAFAVLRYLAENAGCIATTDDLSRAVWAGRHGSESLVKGCVRERPQEARACGRVPSACFRIEFLSALLHLFALRR